MKKLFYGLGAIVAVATPVVAVVSCGSKSEKTTEVGNYLADKLIADLKTVDTLLNVDSIQMQVELSEADGIEMLIKAGYLTTEEAKVTANVTTAAVAFEKDHADEITKKLHEVEKTLTPGKLFTQAELDIMDGTTAGHKSSFGLHPELADKTKHHFCFRLSLAIPSELTTDLALVVDQAKSVDLTATNVAEVANDLTKVINSIRTLQLKKA